MPRKAVAVAKDRKSNTKMKGVVKDPLRKKKGKNPCDKKPKMKKPRKNRCSKNKTKRFTYKDFERMWYEMDNPKSAKKEVPKKPRSQSDKPKPDKILAYLKRTHYKCLKDPPEEEKYHEVTNMIF